MSPLNSEWDASSPNWWGIFFSLGVLVSLIWWLRRSKKLFSFEDALNLYLLCFLAGIVGARLFYFVIHPNLFEWSALAYFWKGGYVLFGGLLAGGIAGLLYLSKRQKPILKTLALALPCLFVALAFIRFGSFLVKDHIGATTSLPWGIDFYGEKRHPTDLYFFLLDLILLFFSLKLKPKKLPLVFFFWATGRLFIHFTMSFASRWDAWADILFWSAVLIGSLFAFGFLQSKNKLSTAS